MITLDLLAADQSWDVGVVIPVIAALAAFASIPAALTRGCGHAFTATTIPSWR